MQMRHSDVLKVFQRLSEQFERMRVIQNFVCDDEVRLTSTFRSSAFLWDSR